MQIGYARTSTVEQEAGLEAQHRDLTAAGAEKLFSEQTSSVGPRPQLDAALDYLSDGDQFICTKLDRVARSVGDLCAIVKRMESKGATLRIIAMGIDTGTPTGGLMLNVIGSVAQFEREVMPERQREGIRKAKGEGRYKGRAPTARAKAAEIIRLAGEGRTKEAIAGTLEVGLASVYRVLRDHRAVSVSPKQKPRAHLSASL
jgi:DNA invertase Pin-like site-specific DNA recombinase